MLEGVQKWDSLSVDEKRLYARMAEVYAGFLEHADAQIGRLMAFLEETKALDDTLVFVFIGDNGSSGEGTLQGLYNEMTLVTTVKEDPRDVLAKIDNLGLPGSYNHYPIGWALAGNTPFKLCKQYTHFGGTRNPLVVHWPRGIKAKGELRHQFHHVIDIVPTILKAAGVEPPAMLNSLQQAPLEGVPMNYTFDDASAPTTRTTQYFEMLGTRAIDHGRLARGLRVAGAEPSPRARRRVGGSSSRSRRRSSRSLTPRSGSSSTSPRTRPRAGTWRASTPRSCAS